MVNKIRGSKLLKSEVLRFIISVGIGFSIDIASFHIFFRYLFVSVSYNVASVTIDNYILSITVSFFLGVLVNFLITRYFVFSESTSSPYKQFLRFMSVAILGYFASIGLLELFIKKFHMYPTLARVTSALSLFFASYFVHKFFSFSLALRHHAPGKKQPVK